MSEESKKVKIELELDEEVYNFLKHLGAMVDKATGSVPKTPEAHAKMILLESLWIMARQLSTGIVSELMETLKKTDEPLN